MAPKVERYEIATYGGLIQLSIPMNPESASDILERDLKEEENMERLFTDLAERDLNLGAERAGEPYSWSQRTKPEMKVIF